MDQFSNAIPGVSDLDSQFAVSPVKEVADMAKKLGATYGLSKEQMEAGFTQTSFQEAASDVELPVGRVAIKRIDA